MEHNNDQFLLQMIVNYCDNISQMITEFSLNEELICSHLGYRAMIAFFVQQIGECASKLSPEFRNQHPEIEWGMIIGFRHHIVHAYGKIIPEILWDTVQNDIPELRDFCDSVLNRL